MEEFKIKQDDIAFMHNAVKSYAQYALEHSGPEDKALKYPHPKLRVNITDKHIKFVATEDDDQYKVDIYMKDAYCYSFTYQAVSYDLSITKIAESFRMNPQQFFDDNAVKTITAITTLCMYVNLHVNTNAVIVKEISEVKRPAPKKSKKKKKATPAKPIILRKRIIQINRDFVAPTKTEREWKVDSFARRGHWRTYKNGKKVWVKATKVHTNANTNVHKDSVYVVSHN